MKKSKVQFAEELTDYIPDFIIVRSANENISSNTDPLGELKNEPLM